VRKGKLHIGTSGWSYKHWKGIFYPADLPRGQEFQYYTERYDTVEINNSFYRLPDLNTFREWRKCSPTSFLFAVKASRFFTHMKKLLLDKEMIRPFFKSVKGLGEKLGPILFQLPPRWKFNPGRLQSFLKILPRKYRYTFEFRDHSWYREETYDILKQYNVSFCIYELEQHISPIIVTADFVYIRLHGPGEKYQGSYSDETLNSWKKKILTWQKQGLDVFIYFDNDIGGHAVNNASRLIQLTDAIKKQKGK
jgi:uncharacterized protein YecE (DUF72 family)